MNNTTAPAEGSSLYTDYPCPRCAKEMLLHEGMDYKCQNCGGTFSGKTVRRNARMMNSLMSVFVIQEIAWKCFLAGIGFEKTKERHPDTKEITFGLLFHRLIEEKLPPKA